MNKIIILLIYKVTNINLVKLVHFYEMYELLNIK